MEKVLIFLQKPQTNPFGKRQIFIFLNQFFTSEINLVFLLKHYTTLFIDVFCIRRKKEKVLIFRQKPWSNLFGKMQIFSPVLNRCFFIFKLSLFLFQNFSELFLLIYFALRQWMEKVLIFRQKLWSNTFEKMQIFGLF